MGLRYFNYYGGKDSMLCHLLPLIPPHDHYVEPFAGSLALFLAKAPSRIETISDKSDSVINFYRITKSHPKSLYKLIDETLYSESDYRTALGILKAPGKDRIKWAWAFWCCANMSFAGDINSGFKLSVKNTSKAVRVFQGKKKAFRYLQTRFEEVQILHRDGIRVIKQTDSKDTLFYCDPPYPLCDQGNYSGYTMKDFIDLLDCLTEIKGMFLLSSTEYPELDEHVRKYRWSQRRFERVLTVNPKRARKKIEVLTFNYLPPMSQKSLF